MKNLILLIMTAIFCNISFAGENCDHGHGHAGKSRDVKSSAVAATPEKVKQSEVKPEEEEKKEEDKK